MKKYLFLDVDGVIAVHWTMFEFSCIAIKRLDRILRETGCEIILSSSWRMHELEATKAFMTGRGFPFSDKITGQTIRAYQHVIRGVHLGIPRGVEIKQWIDTHVHSENGKNHKTKTFGVDYTYCILDDDTDMLLCQQPYFINTDPLDGISEAQTDQAIKILNFRKEDADIYTTDGRQKLTDSIPERIICASIWYKTFPLQKEEVLRIRGFSPYNVDCGVVFSGWRHGNCLYQAVGITGKPDYEIGEEIQGFLTNKNRFVDRKEAMIIARRENQVITQTTSDTLFSEDLY